MDINIEYYPLLVYILRNYSMYPDVFLLGNVLCLIGFNPGCQFDVPICFHFME